MRTRVASNGWGGLSLLALLAALAALGGCETDGVHSLMRADPEPVSDYLPRHDLLVRQPDDFPFHYFYRSDRIRSYDYIYVAPVNTSWLRQSSYWAEFDKMLEGKLGSNVDELASFTREAYEQALEAAESNTHFKVVYDAKRPRTLVVEPALVALVPTKAELNATTAIVTIPLRAIPVLGFSICKAVSLVSFGSVTIECRIRDWSTGEIIAMYSDTENDPMALINISQYTWTYSARINIKTVAENTAAVLAAEDCRSVRRDFPVEWTSMPWEASLDDEMPMPFQRDADFDAKKPAEDGTPPEGGK